MDKSLRNCSNCAHSYGQKSYLNCHRTGRYCESETRFGGLCNNRKTGELQLWTERPSLFKKIIKLVKGE